jgi:Tfp pilus assembly protein PilP
MITRTLSSTCLAVLLLADVSVAQTKPAPGPATTAAPKAASPKAAAPTAPAPAVKAAPTAPAAAAKDAKDASAKDASKDTATIEPQGFTYNAEGRRDPFVSLSRRGADERSNNGPRGFGLAGIASSEVSLKGTLISRGGYVGILQGLDNKSYIVRVGDKLLDGSVRSISADGMVILQQVNDPLSLEKEREVRKLLRQTEEAK